MALAALYAWAMILAPAVTTAWALRQFLVSTARNRLFSDTPLVRIRSAAQGYVKVHGRALPAGATATAAPLSARPCVWWSFKVERRSGKGDDAGWIRVDSASSVETFMLTGAEGECLVGPVHADITATISSVWYGDNLHPGGPPPASGPLSDAGNYRYTESIIAPGTALSVLGELRSRFDDGDIDSEIAAVLRSWKQDQRALLARFDRNNDGHIDSAEWQVAREAAEAFVRKSRPAAPARTTVIGQPINGQPFVIAPLDSARLEQREQRRAALYFCAGLAAMMLFALTVSHRELVHRIAIEMARIE